MQIIDIRLRRPIRQFVDHQSRAHDVSPEETVAELLTLGFDTLLRGRYERYQRGGIGKVQEHDAPGC